MSLLLPSFVVIGLGAISSLYISDVLSKKSRIKEEEEYQLLVSQNKKIQNYKKLIRSYPYYDKVYKKMDKLDMLIIKIEDSVEYYNEHLNEEWVAYINSKINKSILAIEKFISLNQDERKVAKNSIVEMLKFIQGEIKEKSKSLKEEKECVVKEKFNSMLSEIEKED